jgi:uncharacterized protein YecE (DUF72 family)
MGFALGCAVWAYKDWVGTFYPPKTTSKDFLRCYSDRLLTVEGNTTFYSVPSPEMVERWRLETSPGFSFMPKFPRSISHEGLLTPKIPDALQFIERMQGLGDRLGGIFMQLPPSYDPAQLADLSTFIQWLTHCGIRLGVEVRHEGWFASPHREALNQVLRSHNCGRVLLDTRPIYAFNDNAQALSQRKKPKLPLQLDITANFSIIRFITHPHTPNNETFLEQWVQQIAQWLAQDIHLYFYVHCPDEGRSPFTALDLQERLQQHNLPVPSLPWQTLTPNPQQLSLF